MPLITRSIPNLIGGVSQQPEILRLENQATTQENGFSGVVEGLKKRPPTNHIAKISSSAFSNAFIHTINRDINERYIVVITNGNKQLRKMDIGNCVRTLGLKFSNFGYKSIGLRVPEVIITDWNLSNTGLIAIEASKQHNCNNSSDTPATTLP